MKPVLFLDFDGVLNSMRSMLAFGGWSRHQFDPVAVDLVARLVGAADASVVISSAWRLGADVEELKGILGAYSTTLPGRVIDKTPAIAGQRGEEIAAWLGMNRRLHNGNYVIVDDDGDMLDGQLSRFVQCRGRDGFGVPEYLKALRILAPDHRDLTHLAWYETERATSSERRMEAMRGRALASPDDPAGPLPQP